MSAIAIVGGGMLGETILAGLIRSGVSADDLVVVERRAERVAELRERHGVSAGSSTDAVESADTVFLVVKPQDMDAVLVDLAPHLRPDALVISLAAGITVDFIEARLATGTPVVRVMPNTPAQVGECMAVVSPGNNSDESHMVRAESLMGSVGRVVRQPETLMDAVTAVSGSGPAYVFFVVEAMIDAGVDLGLSPEIAKELVVQTVLGAAAMLRETGESPSVLRQQVTSPGGTTAAALRQFEELDVHGAFVRGMTAARDRSRELATGG